MRRGVDSYSRSSSSRHQIDGVMRNIVKDCGATGGPVVGHSGDRRDYQQIVRKFTVLFSFIIFILFLFYLFYVAHAVVWGPKSKKSSLGGQI